MDFHSRLKAALEAAKLANGIIEEYYKQPNITIIQKSDFSPVTDADLKANEAICSYLRQKFPKDAILSEESQDDMTRLEQDGVWIIDPLDGTKDFIAKTDEFSVNIAFAYRHEIVLGVISLPALNEVYYARKGKGAFKRTEKGDTRLHVSTRNSSLRALKSRFHSRPIEEDYYGTRSDFIESINICGSSYKACKIASGEAEVAVKLSEGTKEWDVAANQILLSEAGGIFCLPDGEPMQFNRRDVVNRNGYLMANAPFDFLLLEEKEIS